MAWTAEQMAQKRAKLQKKTNAAAGGAEPLSQRKSADSPPDSGALGSTGNSVSDNKSNTWTAEKMAEKRAALQTQKQQTGTDLYSTALEDYRTRNNLGFADAMDSRSDELNRQKVTVSPAGKMEQNASTVQKLREQRNNGIRMDVYSTVNNWKDASERNRELARLVTDPTLPRGAVSAADLPAGVDYLAADTGGMGIMPVLENTRYMDSDLKKMGYTQDEINRARLYMKAYNNLSLGERAGRRVESDLEGKKENIKGMIGQYAGALSPALTASAEEQMIRRVPSGRYPDEQLEAAGYDPELIRTAHERIRSGELYDKADDDSNRMKGLYEWGRDAHKAGENLTADAMAGESNVGRFFHGATSSAAENLIVSAINPALVLPVLSAQHYLSLSEVHTFTLAGLPDSVKRCHGRKGHIYAGEKVRGARPHGIGRSHRIPVHVHISGEGLYDLIIRRPRNILRKAGLAEAGDVYYHKLRVDAPENIVAQTPFYILSTFGRFYKYIGVLYQLEKYFPALRGRDVKGYSTLVSSV